MRAEARHLGERVDSRVGPARNGETRPAGKDLVERGSKLALHGSLLRLGRPAREIGSVVFERQLEGRHALNLCGRRVVLESVRAFLVVAVAASALAAGCFSGNDNESATGAAPEREAPSDWRRQ